MILKPNAEELAPKAQEIGAEVMRGRVRHPGNQPDGTRYPTIKEIGSQCDGPWQKGGNAWGG